MKQQWREKLDWKSARFEYFYYLVLLCLMITIVLGGFFYFYTSSALRNETIQSNNNILAQLKSSQEFILTEVEKSFAGIVMDPFLGSYMDYFNGDDVNVQQGILSRLESIILSNEYIESIHIYFYGGDHVLSSKQGFEHTSKFYDWDFIQEVTTCGYGKDTFITRNMEDYYSKEEVRVLSFIKYIPIYFVDEPRAILIVNIKEVYLQQVMDSIKIKKDSNIVITDKEGNILSHKTILGEADAGQLKKKIGQENSGTAGAYIDNVNGRKTLVSFLFSERYQWHYIYMVPMASITSSIQLVGIITLALCLLVAVSATIGSFYLSGRLYSPIQAIQTLLNKENGMEASDRANDTKETQRIQRSISNLIDRNKNLEKLLGDYELYQKSMFLRSLVDGEREVNGKLKERLSYYGINVEMYGCFMAYSISMDGYAEFSSKYTEKQQNMLSLYMNENVASVVFERYNGFIAEMGPNNIILVVNTDADTDLENFKAGCYNLGRQIHAVISENIMQTFTIGVSLPHVGIGQLQQCCAEANLALNYRLLFGHNQMILFENVETGDREQVLYPFHIEKNILNNLKIGDREKIMDYLDEFMDYILGNYTESIRLVRNFYLQLLSASFKCIYEIDKNFDFQGLESRDIFSALLEEDTMQGMAEHIRQLYGSVLKAAGEKRSLKNKELAGMVMKYIQSNLNAELSVEKLAEEFYISISYLRKIFKEETNSTLKDYINGLRMNRAKELLEKQDIKISEIAQDIGYLSIQAFTTAFKLYTGHTPSEYRNRYAIHMKWKENKNG